MKIMRKYWCIYFKGDEGSEPVISCPYGLNVSESMDFAWDKLDRIIDPESTEAFELVQIKMFMEEGELHV